MVTERKKEYMKMYGKKYREKNKEDILRKQREGYKRNREKVLQCIWGGDVDEQRNC